MDEPDRTGHGEHPDSAMLDFRRPPKVGYGEANEGGAKA